MRQLQIQSVDPATVPTTRRTRDRRFSNRMSLRELGITAHLRAVDHSGVAASGVLVNLSAGGCCLAVGASAAAGLAVGAHMIVHLPVSGSGLGYPATLTGVDQCPGAPA